MVAFNITPWITFAVNVELYRADSQVVRYGTVMYIYIYLYYI